MAGECSRMEKRTYLILMPFAYNDGTPVSDSEFDRMLLDLSVKFGGCTFLPLAIGGWFDKQGRYQPEKHRPLFVCVDDDEHDELVEWVRQTGKDLDQEVMLVMRDFCVADFIKVESWSE